MYGLTPRQIEYFNYVKKYIEQREASPSLYEVAAAFCVSHETASKMLTQLCDRGALVKMAGYRRSYRIADACDDLSALPNDVRIAVLRESELLMQRPGLTLARICRDYYNRQKREHGGN